MTSFRTVLMLAALLLLCGCRSWHEWQRQRSLDAMRAAALAEIDQKQCAADGGTVQGVGMFGTPACVVPYPDAGKACSDNGECHGACKAPDEAQVGSFATGTCQRDLEDLFGCYSRIDRGVVTATICVD